MSFQEQAALSRDPIFRDRVKAALIKASKNVAAEVNTGKVAHVKRVTRAIGVLNAPENFVDPYVWSVVTNPAITVDSDDNAVEFTINSVYSYMAGVIDDDATTDYNPAPVVFPVPPVNP